MTMPATARPYSLDSYLEGLSVFQHLMVGPVTVTDDTTLADLPEAVWGDYQPQPVGPWTPAVLRGNRAESYAEPVQWTRISSGEPAMIWGAWYTDGPDGPLLWIDLVGPGPPPTLAGDGRPLVLWPRVRWGPECGVVPSVFVGGIRVGGDVYVADDGEELDVRVSFDGENKDSVQLVPGQAVATHGSGVGVIRAVASNPARAAVGLALDGAAPAAGERIQTAGIVTRADWTAVVGSTLLQPHAVYYLDVTDGGLTTVAPTSPGQIVQQIGRAVSTTSLALAIQEAILL